MTTPSTTGHWLEWKQRCALDLCGPGVQSALREFAFQRFARHARHFAHLTNVARDELQWPSDREAWHLFEAHVASRSTVVGKRLKDWLIARSHQSGQDALYAIESGATLIMRDVVREYLRREFSSAGMVSLDALTEAEDNGQHWLEGAELADPVAPDDEAAAKEFAELAKHHARSIVSAMPRRERVVVLAKRIGLSLSHPAVTEAIGLEHAALAKTYREFLSQTALQLRERYCDEEARAVLLLLQLTVEEVMEVVLNWGRGEARCAPMYWVAAGMRETPPATPRYLVPMT